MEKFLNGTWITILEGLLKTARMAAALTKTPADDIVIECSLAVIGELKALSGQGDNQ